MRDEVVETYGLFGFGIFSDKGQSYYQLKARKSGQVVMLRNVSGRSAPVYDDRGRKLRDVAPFETMQVTGYTGLVVHTSPPTLQTPTKRTRRGRHHRMRVPIQAYREEIPG